MEINLRPYQQKAVDEIRLEFSQGARSVMFVLPTGGGKTYTFSYVAHGASKKGNQVLILAHRQELVIQASLSMAKIGLRHNIIAPKSVISAIKIQHVRELGASFVDTRANVAVGSIGTIVGRLDQIKEPSIIIPDECHHAVAGTWAKILAHWPKARILGVTATPIRTDGRGLGSEFGGIFDKMVVGPTMPELIKMGSLVPARVFFPGKAIDLTGIRKTASGDYNAEQLSERIKKEKPTIVGDAIEHYRKLAHQKTAVVFCASIAMAREVAEQFREAGYNFESLDGSIDDSERRKIVKDLTSGALHGITSVGIVSEGFDLPALEVAIMLRPTMSLALYLQQVGRVLRVAPGKTHGLVIDHVGVTIQHGLPHWEREWTLEGQKRKKKKTEEDDEDDVKVKTCPKCFSVQEPAPTCSVCGHVYILKERKIHQEDGELIEMTDDHEALMRKQKKMEVGKARTLSELETVAMQRGYAPGWAKHVFNSRQRGR